MLGGRRLGGGRLGGGRLGGLLKRWTRGSTQRSERRPVFLDNK